MNRTNNDFQSSRPLQPMDELEILQYRKAFLKQEMEKSKLRMMESYNVITNKDKIPSDKWGKTAYFLSRSGTIVNGLRIGLKIGTAISTIVKIKHLFSRSKR